MSLKHPSTSANKTSESQVKIAYFSMEIGIDRRLPTYSGGLGVLAGDTLRSFADLRFPVVGISMLYRKGFFNQKLDQNGRQSESPVEWNPESVLVEAKPRIKIQIEGRPVVVRAWQYEVQSEVGKSISIYFLDTDLPENSPYDRSLSDSLYAGDDRYRLCQETILGIGGVRFLAALGHTPENGLTSYHMNEGHAALLTLALMENTAQKVDALSLPEKIGASDIEKVRRYCLFTTHTPVPAGHDKFSADLALQILGETNINKLKDADLLHNNELHMTHLALKCSRFVNGVAKRHAEVSRSMFPNTKIEPITNGVHAMSWTAKPIQRILDQYTPEWRRDNFYLRNACEIPLSVLVDAHHQAKNELLAMVSKKTGILMDPKVFTIGFARRAAEYKRGDLLFRDTARLVDIAKKHGGLQIVFAGKSHPKDLGGKALIERIFKGASQIKDHIKIAYLENYDLEQGLMITSGVDIWLNNPIKPLEASGTSGMKAAINGVPSLSTLDGWWVEGCWEGVTGWEIEDQADGMNSKDWGNEQYKDEAARSIYDQLDLNILPLWKQGDAYAEIMRNSIAINASYFNTQRMVIQYGMHYETV